MLISCSERNKNSTNKKLYFDFPFVVQKQKAILQKSNPRIIKKTYINHLYATDTIANTDWQKEFAVFENIDLNKPTYFDKIIFKPIYTDTGFVNYFFKKKMLIYHSKC